MDNEYEDYDYEDIEIECIDCGNHFTHDARDQAFYNEQQPPYKEPKRCRPCRVIKKAKREKEGRL